MRFGGLNSYRYAYHNIKKNGRAASQIADERMDYLIEEFMNAPSDELLEEVKRCYFEWSSISDGRTYYPSPRERLIIPFHIAQKIMKSPISYPAIITSEAEKSCRIHITQNLKPVGLIAQEQNWFE